MWGLVELSRRGQQDSLVQLRLEALDDIVFERHGLPTDLLQTKHQVRPTANLTASNVDVWRTLNVWMDVWPQVRDSAPLLHMVTTATAPAGSPLCYLREDPMVRDIQKALDGLIDAAEASTNRTTQVWRQKFLEMDRDQRRQLLGCVVIEDGSATAREIDEPLTAIFRYAIRRGQEEAFLQHLKGWWAGVAVRLMDRSLPAITASDVQSQIEVLVDQFRSDTLPVSPDIIQQRYAAEDVEPYRDRTFVQQLLWIAMEERRLWKAIRDYHRSFTQRSEWLRMNLVAETELDTFAFALHDEWEQIFDSKVAAMASTGNITPEMVGQDILAHLATACRAKLRERFDHPWFTRGMLHALAEGYAGYQIGWHPDFEQKLESLLAHVSS